VEEGRLMLVQHIVGTMLVQKIVLVDEMCSNLRWTKEGSCLCSKLGF